MSVTGEWAPASGGPATVVRQFGMHVLRLYWERRTYKTALALGAVSTAVGVVQFLLMGTFIQDGNTFAGIESYGGDIMSFLLTGSIFTGFVAVSLAAFSGYLGEEQTTGTLESVLVMPVPITRVMLFSGLAGLVGTVLGSVVMIVLFGVVFAVPFSANLAGVVAVLALLVVTTGSFGLAGCGVLLVTKKGDPVQWLLTLLMTLLSGVMYPITIFPGWLQAIATVLPTTVALDGMRLALMRGASPMDILPSLGVLALWSAVMLPLGLWVLRRGLAVARRRGSLGEY